LDKRGDFNVTYYEKLWEYMLKEKDSYLREYYLVYFYGWNPAVFMRNNQFRHGGKKLLVIADSFIWVVAPFLALGVEAMDVLRLEIFTGSVRSYIEQHLPDIVIVLYYPSNIINIDYTSHTSHFDFR
jgi:hypothetical protein